MRRNYSGYGSEESKNRRDATRFIVLTFVAAILLFFFGIPALGKFSGFVSDLAKSDKPIELNDSTPPAPPQFDLPPEFTKETNLKITGKAEEGATVKLSFNGKDKEIVAGTGGAFSFDLDLQKGENTFSAIAVDSSGNESLRSKEYTTTYDNKSPDLTIESPADGSSFFGEKQKQIEVKGKTEEGTQMTINDRFVNVNDDGTFKFTTTLSDGENKFNIKATDRAGNQTEKDIVVNFSS